MKLEARSAQRGDMSLLDLLAIIAAVAIVGFVGLAYVEQRPRSKGQRIRCMNNLKCVGLAFRLWADDNGDKVPGVVSTNQGGAMELLANGSSVPIFNVMSNEIGTPKFLLCPADGDRNAATNFPALTVSNLSYFVVPEADEALPSLWLSGDRNLTTNGASLKPGITPMPASRAWGWGSGLHTRNNQPGGNIGFADGSVRQCTDKTLHQTATNALAVFLTTNAAPFRLLIP